ncbi:MAG: amidophosphoribosyltransferase [Actinobacteria bacterium]|nr:MAG: amidophosphoribosyltransferase [Actinomycetota bacterium]
MTSKTRRKPSSDRPEEACGIFGIFAPGEEASRLTYFGLHALQHRGQESAGIAVSDGRNILLHKEMGLVPQVFDEETLAGLAGHLAIGHTRYSTTGSTDRCNAQPVEKSHAGGTFAVAHNGNLINTKTLRDDLLAEGVAFDSTSDTEVIANLVAGFDGQDLTDAIAKTMKMIQGAYSVLVMDATRLYAFRDPHGIRPLVIGKMGENYVVASETCGLDIVGACHVRDVAPGELVVIDSEGMRTRQVLTSEKASLCIFEFIYFARPDSRLYGRTLYHARKHMGMRLAEESPADADLVIGVPDSGTSAAIGYAETSGIPFGEGLIKNRYVGRTFIEPTQRIRQQGIRLKLNPLRESIQGKRLIVVDDSIVRGNTSKKIVAVLKEAGAAEVHMRITSPPIKWPCFYGIDTDTREQLIASSKTVEEVGEFIGVDSLRYLSFEGLVSSTNRSYGEFCLACFDGDYPIPIPEDVRVRKLMLEEAGCVSP